jgi:chromosome segregation ATPase
MTPCERSNHFFFNCALSFFAWCASLF